MSVTRSVGDWPAEGGSTQMTLGRTSHLAVWNARPSNGSEKRHHDDPTRFSWSLRSPASAL
jgi:hypothetical protein